MNSFWPKIKENPIFAVLLAVLLATLIVSLIFLARNLSKQHYYIGKNTDLQRTISINGEGKVTAVPDIALVSLGLSTEKKTVSEAQAENSKTMNSLIEKLKALDIAKEDIKTTNYNIYPAYDWTDGKQVLRGYTASQDVQVKIRQTDKVEQVLKIAGDLNLNQIGGLSFSIDEPEKYREEARQKALANAKSKAQTLSDVMGVKLGKIVSFNESEGYQEPIYSSYAKVEGMGGAAPAPAVEAGSQEVIIYATIMYELE